MLSKAMAIAGYTLGSIDGDIGKVEEFYFDDNYWTIRYLVADTGNWLADRQVLISPYALGAISDEHRRIDIDLTKSQIEGSPSLNSDKPVSRQFEEDFYGYYGWPRYWGGPYAWGSYPKLSRDRKNAKTSTRPDKEWNPHLRSTRDAIGHTVAASDGDIGRVADFIIDDEAWTIRYLVIDTGTWMQGKKVLIPPGWIDRISWSESKVYISLSRDAVKRSPKYSDEALLTREYEIGLHRHYSRQGYWVEEHSAASGGT